MQDKTSLETLSKLLSHVCELIVIVDAQGGILLSSAGFQAMETEANTSFSVALFSAIAENIKGEEEQVESMSNALEKALSLQHIPLCWDERDYVLNGTILNVHEDVDCLILLKLNAVARISNQSTITPTNVSQQAELQLMEEAVRMRTIELEQANEELRQANRDLTSFTNITNHDLQEPLRKIQNFVIGIKEDGESRLSASSSYYLKRLHASAKRMQRLLEDVLRYSKIRDKKRLFVKSDLTQLVREVVKDFLPILDEKQAVMEIQPLGEIEVVPDQFKELVRQLLANTLKFHKPLQKPSLSIKSRYMLPDSDLLKSQSARTQYLNLIFEDQGIGIDEQYRDKIFEVFQQLHPAGTFEGTGIGLPICKRIVENHNGFIQASGKKDQGMRVDVYLPLRQDSTLQKPSS